MLGASPGAVFSAWTEPAELERWSTGVGGWVDAKADVDLRVGGRYHFSMRDEGGWRWENEPTVMRGSEGSLVEVALREAPGGTQLTLTHSGLGTELVRDVHEEGWNALVTSLFGTLS